MNRSRLDRFDACRDCFFWKVKRFLSERKESLLRFMKCEVDQVDKADFIITKDGEKIRLSKGERELVHGMMLRSQKSLAPLMEKEAD
jgi:hypothetical protein